MQTVPAVAVADQPVERRAEFMVKTYNTLFGAIVAFTLIEIAIFQSGLAEPIAAVLLQSWMLTLGGFMILGWIGSAAAARTTGIASYAALGFYVLMEALIFVPMLFLANHSAPGAISSAALVTIVGFAGLTGIVWKTRKDFSFMGAILRWIGLGAILLIGASLIFGLELGTFFSVGMVVFAGAVILYETSNVLHHYPEDRHVSAALSLFAAVALMFWYVLRLFMSRD